MENNNNDNLLLKPAAKKKSIWFKREYPFPIISSDIVEEQETDPEWKYLEGHLQENCVLVHDEESMKLLYSKGFYGTGTLSRYGPKVCFKKPNCEDKGADNKVRKTEEKSVRQKKRRRTPSPFPTPGPSHESKEDEVILIEDSSNEIPNYFLLSNVRQKKIKRTKSPFPTPGPSQTSEEDDIIILEHSSVEVPIAREKNIKRTPSPFPTPGPSQDSSIKVSNLKTENENEDIEVVGTDSNLCVDDMKPEHTESLDGPYSAEKESLQLTFEEAYFLSYGLGCLVVKDKDQLLNLERLWNKFCELSVNKNFPVMYTAYHHFRSKGWIVRCGLRYGVDYVLYKDGPPFNHSTYLVIVKHVKEQGLQEVSCQRFTWSSLAALNRVTTTVGKGLMFLYVITPDQVSENEVLTPFCIPEYKLEEVLVKRWVPSASIEEIKLD